MSLVLSCAVVSIAACALALLGRMRERWGLEVGACLLRCRWWRWDRRPVAIDEGVDALQWFFCADRMIGKPMRAVCAGRVG